MSESQTIIDALQSENASIKQVLEAVNAKCEALEQTVRDVVGANINFKAGALLLERKIVELNNKIKEKDAQIDSLNAQVKSLSPAVEPQLDAA